MRPFQAYASSSDDASVKGLPTRLSDQAQLGGRIISRGFSTSGIETYHVQIGSTLTPGISLDEVLDFVSEWELERFENAKFRDEEKVLRERAIATKKNVKRRGRPRKQTLLPIELGESENTATGASTPTTATSDDRTGSEPGGRGRPRPAYTHFYPKQRQRKKNLHGDDVAVIIGKKPAAVTAFQTKQTRASASPSRDIAGLTFSPYRTTQQPKRIKLDYSSESSSATSSSQARSSRGRSPEVRIPASESASPAKRQGIIKAPPEPRSRKPASPSRLDSSVHGMVAAAAYGKSSPVSAASYSAAEDPVTVAPPSDPAAPPTASAGSDSGESASYDIEAILAHHESDPRTHPAELGNAPVMLYQVKWEGYDQPTWEPAESFEDQEILEEYWARVNGGQGVSGMGEGAAADREE